ncbi:MAG: twin arginine-targeting protein translocase TatC [Desulfobacterium sp. 4572_20]|nr:twin-arginine translocase subunit TatC [Deltaproteobacteria bacterium]MBW2104624.1 twin-arginine translocase subunit TatC [Deltaproteobacteria bacterium]OQY17450.1 MAG: twin arginine-targeting protein translocase TatC [Desulfobacterium sp. 4572_20]HDH86472.1 twin-arginine translocase subunit TatC [Desulfobacteraceae bacterium]
MTDDKQPFLDHLEELRRRLVICAIAVGLGFIISYVFAKQLFSYLILPLTKVLPEDSRLIFTNLPEMFIAYIKVALVAGIILAIPIIFYQLWMFLAPALYQKEKRYIIPFVLFSSILFAAGALFGYLVVFPYGFKFFVSFATEDIQALPSVKQYFSFAIRLLLAFGLVFEMPIVVLFLTKIGLITPDKMKEFRKFAILSSFILAAILTPPDVATQLMMALPIIILYEISIFLSKTMYRKKEGKSDTMES